MNDPGFTVEGDVATIRFKHTGVFNNKTLAAVNCALDQVEANDDITLLVFTGEDKNFSQGYDLEFLASLPSTERRMEFVHRSMLMIGRLLRFPIPVTAAINGHAFGLGAMLVLAADYAAMRRDRGYFCLPEVDLEMTLTPRLNALVTHKMTPRAIRDTLLTGGRLGAEQAHAFGIIDAGCAGDAVLTTAIELAAPMRGKHRPTVGALKRGANLAVIDVIESTLPEKTM
ncbi:putative enoyl-CoA hydratase/isomerase family protein [Luminiphilus syltensis NOR5-1B]|uniref:Putative enoyl-CoA hydratase/isomerase family protein n=1 Tax=Luminiphilus syltensis NOR5-1B TaxID=565045 RepID=B8KWN8_9GAMM|nr:enoyl-CoA hydratase/isomerase family protein [Luminiphilus syltensis]EED35641.1 putative enoyl-CoA hydratase/isomerase family protein [Luminiphilus syltensis NOR5-1B]